MYRYLREALRFETTGYTYDVNVMPIVNIPPDHMEAKMRFQHIVRLNCRSAPLKIGHTAESSGGCGTWQGKKRAFTEKQEKRDSSKAPAEG